MRISQVVVVTSFGSTPRGQPEDYSCDTLARVASYSVATVMGWCNYDQIQQTSPKLPFLNDLNSSKNKRQSNQRWFIELDVDQSCVYFQKFPVVMYQVEIPLPNACGHRATYIQAYIARTIQLLYFVSNRNASCALAGLFCEVKGSTTTFISSHRPYSFSP